MLRIFPAAKSFASIQLRHNIVEVSSSNNFSLSVSNWKGHSHWQNIQKGKKAEDEKKGKLINTYIVKLKDAVAAPGGFDVKLNKKLAALIADYRKDSLPMETLNRRLEKLKEDAKKPKSAPKSEEVYE